MENIYQHEKCYHFHLNLGNPQVKTNPLTRLTYTPLICTPPSSPRLLLYLRIPRECDSVSSSHCVHLLTQIQLQSISTRPLLNLKIDPHPYCPSHFLSRSINYKHTFSHVNSLFFCCLPCPRPIQIAFFTLPDMKSFNFGQKQYLNQTFICPFIKTQPIWKKTSQYATSKYCWAL